MTGKLTKREVEVVKLIAEGLTSKEAAQKLGTSPRTVEAQRRSIYTKLELGNLADLIRYAIRSGYVRP